MIKNISPIDGRYASKSKELGEYFSEFALIKNRVFIEVRFFEFLLNELKIKISDGEKEVLKNLTDNFSEKDAEEIKNIEKTTNHDVKAVEYFIKDKIGKASKENLEFIHFACTSEDINNLSNALMLKSGISKILIPEIKTLLKNLKEKAEEFADISMLSHTHGQPASPTTLGKEFKIYEKRIERFFEKIEKLEFLGKINGASGNFNAHFLAYPEIDWIKFSQNFVKSLGLTPNNFTNQIESHDYYAEIFSNFKIISNIVINFNQDIWSYISKGYFKQKLKEGEIGSSAMPHKVNPIDFENSEGNLKLGVGFFDTISNNLQISRLQRDLTDSTIQRNIGVGFSYFLIAIKSTLKGIGKLKLNEKKIDEDLENNWAVLAEAIQTLMRKEKYIGAYEKLKELTRGKEINKKIIQNFIENLDISKNEKEKLINLTPQKYIGLANILAKKN